MTSMSPSCHNLTVLVSNEDIDSSSHSLTHSLSLTHPHSLALCHPLPPSLPSFLSMILCNPPPLSLPPSLSLPPAAGADYNPQPQTVTFGATASQACVNISIVDDTIVESTESFRVIFSVPSDINMATPSMSTVTILDDDGKWYCEEIK